MCGWSTTKGDATPQYNPLIGMPTDDELDASGYAVVTLGTRPPTVLLMHVLCSRIVRDWGDAHGHVGDALDELLARTEVVLNRRNIQRQQQPMVNVVEYVGEN
jgi:hypothetical protein